MPASHRLPIAGPDCMTFGCADDCCRLGCDVWPSEREALLRAGLATLADFGPPYVDEEGDTLHRTRVAERGCVFLDVPRGCRLHGSGLKPEVCTVTPRSPREADHLADLLPCRVEWRWAPSSRVGRPDGFLEQAGDILGAAAFLGKAAGTVPGEGGE